MMVAIIHAQTVMLQETLDILKKQTHRENTKDALSDAADHYLVCKEKELRVALQTAKEYIALKTAGSANKEGEAIIKQIDNALEVK